MASTEAPFVCADSPKGDAVRVDVDSAPDATTHGSPGLTLEWRNVTLERAVTPAASHSAVGDVSGSALPGELLAVMGPSGAGKTTLLNVLSGRATAGLSAEAVVTVAGRPWTRASKRQLAAYVLQDDLFYETLTVHEHLRFQARLRGGQREQEQRPERERVEQVLRDYGLEGVRRSLIGGPHARGLSGGERKRLSLASEALGGACVWFADEPTSGLDSATAAAVVAQLRRLARRDRRTVVATVHQPSSQLFAQFDRLCLLATGRVVYHGPAADAVAYFAERGCPCPAFVNPSDFFMAQLATASPSPSAPAPALESEPGTAAEGNVDGRARLERLVQAWEAFRRSEACASTLAPLQGSASDGADREPAAETKSSAGAPVPIARQVGTLMRRNVVRLVRDKLGFRVALAQALMTALLAGLVYLQLEVSQRGVQSFVGAFFFLTVSQVMVPANGQFMAVPSELALIAREYRAGLYHVAAWYAAKNASELPLQVLLPVVFYVPAYLLIGVGRGAGAFLSQLAVLMLLHSTAVGFGYMVSCLSRRGDLTPVVGIAALLPMLLLGGLLVNSDDIPAYLRWVAAVSPFKYGFEALMTSFWTRVDRVPCPEASALACSARTGEQVLQSFSMAGRSVWTSGLALLALNAAFRLAGLAALAVALNRRDDA